MKPASYPIDAAEVDGPRLSRVEIVLVAVVSLVGRELVSGSLRQRQRDCLWVHAVASPHRGFRRTFHLGNQLAGEGISGDDITNTGSIDWFDDCLPGDLYGDANLRGTYLRLGYELGIELTL